MGHHKSIGGVTPFLKIQEGTWAGVFKAHDASLDRYVLLKVLHDRFRNDEALVSQFEQEARLMAKVQHPNVVQILSYGEDQNQVYLTTAFIEGFSLKQLLESHGKLPAPVALHIVQDMARGLQAAHNQQILHRDLKPANVLIAHDGQVKLTDFGLATLKQTDQATEGAHQALAGTPEYMAPESITGAPPSVQGDLFALGATLFEMLTGNVAFRGADSRALFDSLLHYDPIPALRGDPALPLALLGLCDKLLKKSPEARPADAAIVVQDIEQIKSLYTSFQGQVEVQRFIEAPDAYQAPALSVQPETHTTLADPAPERTPSPRPHAVQQKPRKRGGAAALLAAALMVAVVSIAAYKGLDALNTLKPAASETETLPPAPLSPDLAEADTLADEEKKATQPVLETPSILPAPEPDTEPDTKTQTAGTVSEDDVATLQPVALRDDSLQQTEDIQPALPGNLTVLCTPWCDVLLDGNSIGAAPPAISYAAPAGSYELALVNPHYPTFSQRVALTAGKQDTVRLSFKDYVASVELEILPWAEVFIDSVAYGTLPPNKTVLLAPGTHTITLKNRELGEWQGQLIVTAGEKRRQPYNLRELINN